MNLLQVAIGGDGSLTGGDLFRREWPSLLEELASEGRITPEQVRLLGDLCILLQSELSYVQRLQSVRSVTGPRSLIWDWSHNLGLVPGPVPHPDSLIKLLKKGGFVVLFWLRYARHARHYFTFWVCQCMFYLGNTNKKSNSRPIFFQTARNETKRDQMQ